MDLGVLEQKLRALPGVLDCSVSSEGVAVVVHPEVDPRMIEVQAQVLLAECGDRRPLLVVGGMTVGPPVVPSRPPRADRARRTAPSPLLLAVFAVLVLGLLAVVPITEGGLEGRPVPSDRPSPSAIGRVPLEDAGEEVVLTVGPPEAPVVEAPAPAPASTPSSGGSTVRLASVPPAPAPAAPAVTPAALELPVAPVLAASSTRKGHGRKAGEVRAAAVRGKAEAVALAKPGASERPGRRRGHHR